MWGALVGLCLVVGVLCLVTNYHVKELEKNTNEKIEELTKVVVEQDGEIHAIQGRVVDLSYDLLDALDEYDEYFEGYDANNRTDELLYLKNLTEE